MPSSGGIIFYVSGKGREKENPSRRNTGVFPRKYIVYLLKFPSGKGKNVREAKYSSKDGPEEEGEGGG